MRSVYLYISKIHSVLAETNLLALNNISHICYSSQTVKFHFRVLQLTEVFLIHLVVTFILLVMVHYICCVYIYIYIYIKYNCINHVNSQTLALYHPQGPISPARPKLFRFQNKMGSSKNSVWATRL